MIAAIVRRTSRRNRISRREHVIDFSYAAGWRVVRAMPEALARVAFDTAARYTARGGGPDQLRRNLARVLGVAPDQVPDAMMRASLASYARYWREVFRLPAMDHHQLAMSHDGVTSGHGYLDDALAAGRGAIVALPHMGNWDIAGVWLVYRYGMFTTVAERLKPESLYQRFIAYRESLGFEVLSLTGGQRPPYEVLAERLAENKIVCLLADRDMTRSGVQVNFFGETTQMPSGPARLALQTGASLLSACCWFAGDGWGCEIGPPLDCSGGDSDVITQMLADQFAAGIARHPQDWHMLQPQWLVDVGAQRQGDMDRRAGAQRQGDMDRRAGAQRQGDINS